MKFLKKYYADHKELQKEMTFEDFCEVMEKASGAIATADYVIKKCPEPQNPKDRWMPLRAEDALAKGLLDEAHLKLLRDAIKRKEKKE